MTQVRTRIIYAISFFVTLADQCLKWSQLLADVYKTYAHLFMILDNEKYKLRLYSSDSVTEDYVNLTYIKPLIAIICSGYIHKYNL